MKMGKIFFALAGIMTVVVANALTTEEIMARCKASDKTVWDSFNKTCVPKNPCEKDGYDAYCVKDFAEAKIDFAKRGAYFTKGYAKHTDGQDATCDRIAETNNIGCTYDNGHYVVFVFDDLSAKEGEESMPRSMEIFHSASDAFGCYGDNSVPGEWVKHPMFPDFCLLKSGLNGTAFRGCTGDYTLGDGEAFNTMERLESLYNITFSKVGLTCKADYDRGHADEPKNEKGFCFTVTCE